MTMATTTSSQAPPKPMEKYQYQPIRSPDQLRMLKLLPGRDDEPIRIRLRHRPLSSMPQCEALSYEWGSPTRDHEIECESKTLKVTANLLGALKRLRPKKSLSWALKKGKLPWKSRLLWIDALCINQDDDAERSEQVKLMGEVYRKAQRVLVWIGEAPPLVWEAFHLIPRLAKIIERLNLSAYENPQSVEGTLEIQRGFTLEQLADETVWPALRDILCSRTYFSRLWTVQEITLSSLDDTLICCGSHSLPWREYRNASTLLIHCKAFHGGLARSERQNLLNVDSQGILQKLIQERNVGLIDCIHVTQYRVVSDRRDRVFALLGMVDDITRSQLQKVGYSSSLGKIFQAATECLIRESESLSYLTYYETSVIDRTQEPDIPSWVSWMDFNPLVEITKIFAGTDRVFIPETPVTIHDSVLEVSGFVFDVVVNAYDNLSKANFKSQILKIHDELAQSPSTSRCPHFAIDVLWQILTLENGVPGTEEHLDFAALIAQLNLERMGFAEDIFAQNPKLSVLAEDNPLVKTRFAAALAADLDVETLRTEDNEMANWVRQASEGDGDAFGWYLEDICEERTFISTKYEGRNMFISAKGYGGVGPTGDNRPENASPAVQVGDCIAILSTAPAPVILRPIDEAYFSFVGLAQVPYLTDDPDFKKSVSEEFRKFQIR